MPTVKMPNGDLVRFPDDMPKENITAFIQEKFPDAFKTQEPAEPQKQEPGTLERVSAGLRLLNPAQSLGHMIGTKLYDMAPEMLNSAVSAATAPGRALSGDLQVHDPYTGRTSMEAIKEATNLAGWINPASPGSINIAPRTAALTAAETMAAKEGNRVAQAANRVGVDVPLYAASDSKIVQSTAKGLENTPLFGRPILNANEKAVEQVGAKVSEISQKFGKGSIANAGNMARAGIKEYNVGFLKPAVKARYDAVDALVTPNVVTPLSNTRSAAGRILSDIVEARSTRSSEAVKLVSRAMAEKDGLTYQGIKKLRTEIGDYLDNPEALARQGLNQEDVKAIYAGLTEDLKAAVRRAGGPDALKKFEEANAFASKAAKDRIALDKILGNETRSDEAIFDSIRAMAGTTSRADIKRLLLARKAVGEDGWNEITSAILSDLGRDASGNFSFDRYLTGRAKISDAGKKALFGAKGKGELEAALKDIDTVAKRFSDIQKKYGNPSGTARNISIFATGAAIIKAPHLVVAGAISGNALSALLAKPATAKTVADYMKAYELAARLPGKTSNEVLSKSARALAAAATGGDQQAAQQLFFKLASPQKAAADQNNGDPIGVIPGQDQGGQADKAFNDAYLQGRAS